MFKANIGARFWCLMLTTTIVGLSSLYSRRPFFLCIPLNISILFTTDLAVLIHSLSHLFYLNLSSRQVPSFCLFFWSIHQILLLDAFPRMPPKISLISRLFVHYQLHQSEHLYWLESALAALLYIFLPLYTNTSFLVAIINIFDAQVFYFYAWIP